MNIHSLTLRKRFIVLLSTFIAGFLVYGFWSIKTLNDVKVNGALYEKIIQNKDLIADVLPPPEYVIESYLVSYQLTDAAISIPEKSKLVKRLHSLKKDYDTRHDFWVAAGLEDALKDAMLRESHEAAVKFFDVVFKELVPAVEKEDAVMMAAALDSARSAYEKHRKGIDRVVELASKNIVNDEAVGIEAINYANKSMMLLLTGSMLIACGLAMVIAHGVIRQVGGEPVYASRKADQMAAGDLSIDIEVSPQDKSSALFALKRMKEILSVTVEEIRSGATMIATASSEIAAGSADLASRTEQQSTSIAETSATMEEISSIVRSNAEAAEEANEVAQVASDMANKGGDVVKQVVGTMSEINDSSKRISEIITVIDGIAFQTNILALNAAVEAARAGEQGKGFAVVASEVRSLAQRSASAAKEIKVLIMSSVDKVHIGSQQVEAAGKTIEAVVASVGQVSELISGIAVAGKELALGMDQIGVEVAEMDAATQTNAALVEESAAAAKSLQEQANQLAELVSTFKTGNN